MSGPLRGIVAGAGLLGPYWGRELVESADTELCGWADLEPERARTAAAELGVAALPVDASLERLLDEQRPDFLVNVTPPAAHHDTTMAALERGLDVLTEKPLAATMAEAEAMIAAADRAGRLFMVSQNRRYMPELVAFRDTVAQLGPLSTLTCEFHIAHRVPDSRFLNSFPQPLLLDMAIHLFDGARAITGAEPLSVYCDSYNPPWSWYSGPAAAHAVFRMSDELRFAFTGNWAGRRVPHVVDGYLARGRRARRRHVGGRRGRPASRRRRRERRSRRPARAATRSASSASRARWPTSWTPCGRAACRPASATTTSAAWPCATRRSSRRDCGVPVDV